MVKYSLIVFLIFVNAHLIVDFGRLLGRHIAEAHQASRDAEIDNQFADSE